MKSPKEKWWSRARKARAELEARFLHHPEVSMIDLGEDPQAASAAPVLRLHVRHRGVALAGVPKDLQGIPVRVIYGSYELQNK